MDQTLKSLSPQVGDFSGMLKDAAHPMKTIAGSIWNALYRMAEVSRQRHHLKSLDSRLLKDVGLTRAQVAAEAGRAPWNF